VITVFEKLQALPTATHSSRSKLVIVAGRALSGNTVLDKVPLHVACFCLSWPA